MAVVAAQERSVDSLKALLTMIRNAPERIRRTIRVFSLDRCWSFGSRSDGATTFFLRLRLGLFRLVLVGLSISVKKFESVSKAIYGQFTVTSLSLCLSPKSQSEEWGKKKRSASLRTSFWLQSGYDWGNIFPRFLSIFDRKFELLVEGSDPLPGTIGHD